MPDNIPLVIVDSTAEDLGLETCREIHARWPDCKIVFMAADCQSQMVAEAFHAGIDGYLGKNISCASLAEMLKLVALGEKMIPSQVVFDLASLKSDKGISELKVTTGDANLSDRELEIFKMIGKGMTTRQIAGDLHLSVKTVETHRENIKAKLDIPNSAELSREAVQWVMENGA